MIIEGIERKIDSGVNGKDGEAVWARWYKIRFERLGKDNSKVVPSPKARAEEELEKIEDLKEKAR